VVVVSKKYILKSSFGYFFYWKKLEF
jgi:hypothetical protein